MNRVSDINRSLLIPQNVVAPVQITIEYASSNEASDDYDNVSIQEDSFRFDTKNKQNINTIWKWCALREREKDREKERER